MAQHQNDRLFTVHRHPDLVEAHVSFNADGVPTLMKWNYPVNGQPGYYTPASTPLALATDSGTGANVSATTGTFTVEQTFAQPLSTFPGSTLVTTSGASYVIESAVFTSPNTVFTVVGGASPFNGGYTGVASITSPPLSPGQTYGAEDVVSFQQLNTIYGDGTAAADLVAAPDYLVTFARGYQRIIGPVTVTQLGAFNANTPTLPALPDVSLNDSNFPTSAGLVASSVAPTATGLGFFQDSFSLTVPHSSGPTRYVALQPAMTALSFAQAVNQASVDWISITIGGVTCFPILTTSITNSALATAINTAIAKMAIQTLIKATVSTYVTIGSPSGAPVQSFQINGNPATLAALGFGAGTFTSATNINTETSGWVPNPFTGAFVPTVQGGILTTSTGTGALSWTQSSASFPTAGTGLAGQYLLDHLGVPFVIVSNTATVLTLGGTSATPTSGAGAIVASLNPSFAMGDVYATVASGQVVLTKNATGGVDFDIGGAAPTLANLGFVAGEATSSQTSANGINVPGFQFQFVTQLGTACELLLSVSNGSGGTPALEAGYSGTAGSTPTVYFPASQTIIFSFLMDASTVG